MAKLTAERLNLQTTNVVDAGIKDSYVFADDWDMPKRQIPPLDARFLY
jgi:hypothetical protein